MKSDHSCSPTKILGHHWLMEFYGCASHALEAISMVENHMLEAAKAMQCKIVDSHFHQFNPVGVSGVIIIQESHLTIHTWPELGYAAVDLFTCGVKLVPENGMAILKKGFEAQRVELQYIARGRALTQPTIQQNNLIP